MYYSNVSTLEMYRIANILFEMGFEPGEKDVVLRKHYTKDEIEHINATIVLLKETERNEKANRMSSINEDVRNAMS